MEVICFICVTVNSYNCNYFKVKYYLPEFLHMLKIGNVCTDPLEKGTLLWIHAKRKRMLVLNRGYFFLLKVAKAKMDVVFGSSF